MRDPDTTQLHKVVAIFGHNLANEHSDFSSEHSLVVLELLEPPITPILCSLRFPYDGPAELTGAIQNSLDQIGAIHALRYGLDVIGWERTPKQLFKLQFKNFALGLLGSLFQLPLEFIVHLECILQLLVLFGIAESESLLK